MRHLLVLSLVLTALSSGCLFEKAKRDGAACSESNQCPPGQRCSGDGQCLFPCPNPVGCQGTGDVDCGCSSISRANVGGNEGGWACLADGLCHFKCVTMGPDNWTCPGYMNCDTSTFHCLPACSGAQECANGAACVPTGQTNGGSNGVPPNYCAGTGPVGDGGVKDGGEDAGRKDGGQSDSGTWVQCNGTPVDVSRDPTNCGTCNHNCQGGDCVGGTCQPYLLAAPTGMFNVQAIAIDGSDVFFADQGTDSVYRCLKTGCNTAVKVNTDPAGGAHALAADVSGPYVYWASSGDSRLHSCQKTGCDGPALALPNEDGRGIAVDTSYLYFVSGNAIQRCDPGSCAGGATTIWGAGPGNVWAVAAFGGRVFWANTGTTGSNGSVSWCPNAGGCASPTVLAAAEDQPAALAISPDGNAVYWRTSTAIMWCGVMGCSGNPSKLTPIPFDNLLPGTDRLAVASHGIYWDSNGHLYRCADAACLGGPQTLPPTQIWPHIAADNTYVYFATSDGVYRLAP